MLRELTKSAMSLSWALSLLGVKQAVSLARPNQQNGGNLFAPMTQAAVGQLDDSLKNIYRSADGMGGRAVDMAFWWMNPMNWMNPSGWTNWMNPSGWMKRGGNCGCGGSTGPSASGPSAPGTASGSGGPTGWGPMPDSKP